MNAGDIKVQKPVMRKKIEIPKPKGEHVSRRIRYIVRRSTIFEPRYGKHMRVVVLRVLRKVIVKAYLFSLPPKVIHLIAINSLEELSTACITSDDVAFIFTHSK